MFKYISIFLFVLLVGCGPLNPLAPIGMLIDIGMYWVNGEAHKYYNCDQVTLYDATKVVIKDLDMVIESEEEEADYIHIKARVGKDNLFKIKIHKITDKVSKLSIRINTWGDKPFAELFYKMTDKQPNVNEFETIEALEAALKKGGIKFKRR